LLIVHPTFFVPPAKAKSRPNKRMIRRFCAESARFMLLEVWAMDIDTSALFAPIVINGHTVKNRLSAAPMTRISATQDGRATETMTRHYERFAPGGFGTVVRFSFW
jgi:NADH:flavin oxidoreductase / NADH oxidase family